MKSPKYWRGLEELEQRPEFLAESEKEFFSDVPLVDKLESVEDKDFDASSNRRDFLKVMGFGITAATLAACVETPLKKAIPMLDKPEDLVPGVANWYASTTEDGTPVLVKTREGRPIKLEGNPDAKLPLTGGGLDAVGQAAILSLYDLDRLRGPQKKGNNISWANLDKEVREELNKIKSGGGKIRILTDSVVSPTARKLIANLVADGYADVKHVSYDALSSSAIAQAHGNVMGKKQVPSYDLSKANTIVSINCDFLGTWIDPVAHSAQYAVNRDPDSGHMSRHFQLESLMTITGASADLRYPIKPSDEGKALLALYNKVASKMGKAGLSGGGSFNVAMNGLDKMAEELAASGGKAVVLCGSNNVATQTIVTALNKMIGAYGKTININQADFRKQGDDAAMAALVADLTTTDALIIWGANPVYNTPHAKAFAEAIPRITLTVAIAVKEDETSTLCKYTAAASHWLESWGDASQPHGFVSLRQPAINPIFDTRQAEASLMAWTGSEADFESVLKGQWRSYHTGGQSFRKFWNASLRKGIVSTGTVANATTPEADGEETAIDLSSAASLLAASKAGGNELVLYPKVSLRDGKYANNPWLQELPDPITRISWDNYLTVPFQYAKENGLNRNDTVTLKANGQEVTAAIVVVPGQALGVFGLALGYNRKAAGRTAKHVSGSIDAYPFLTAGSDKHTTYTVSGVDISPAGGQYELACVQTFHTLFDPEKAKGVMGTDFDRTEHIISETYFDEYHSNSKKVNQKRNAKKKHLVTLWESHFEDREANRFMHWAMAIDMNKCTGCAACIVSCNAENNVPVVGKQEVLKRREMHWIRLDRYYSGHPDNPDIVIQPMLCQHCDNAGCETVCPVMATLHSKDGLNQMAYNRCVGTRYCANNCPYKVRRFNWFNYVNGEDFADINPAQNNLGRLVLNPDVTVRFRGVMEKCSFCAQRIQEGKLRAKLSAGGSMVSYKDGNTPHTDAIKPKDGEIVTACQQSCPSGAIVFGDVNDPESAVAKLVKQNDRSYTVIEEVKALPAISYLAKVRNRTKAENEAIKVPYEGHGQEAIDNRTEAWDDGKVMPQIG